MKRLAEQALIYGRLHAVEAPHLIARYNKALSAFGVAPTGLERFSIDMTGFSPEIAAALGDRDYLDPNGVNRRFIILTPEQEGLPVVHTRFSNTAGLMHAFFEANRRVISAVTIKDALYGEIEEDVTQVEDIEDLLRIEEVRFRVLSADDLTGKAAELRTLVDRLETSAEAWRDEAMLARMVALAQETGDIRHNRLVPDQLVFPHRSFWADHFGGVFLFRDARSMVVIGDREAPGFRRSRPWEVSYIDIRDHQRIFDFLARSKRIQVPQASWVERSGLLAHRAEMAVRALIGRTAPEIELDGKDAVWLQTYVQRHAAAVAEDGLYPFFQQALNEVARDGIVRLDEIAPERRLLLVRANPEHDDKWLVNRLLARLAPFDFASRFMFDKQGFYETYAGYPENFRAHVVSWLVNAYLPNKRALRARLYGLDGANENA
ncbi:DUF6638 family protein [Pseudohoeflea coraliihabitans]|uniref:Uncharacterized protein n=1 Tax=Pseudohoeflea coraliihabitans TaxID=2860393 RepID=A0ABS6WM49_9HYPH|nr:DUF6638 family protein [Pseudohoeflea sp. DP4N28-3]MBW3096149.1 hypothetical protein [Pseudohoeflea sp. DP4N28-3]